MHFAPESTLAAYLGSIRHPLEEPDVLEFHPLLWGTRATVVFSGAAAMLYLFYVYGKESDRTSLLFLGVGNFLAFYGFASAVVGLQRAERQKLVWSSMTTVQRVAWVKDRSERQQKFREFLEEMEKTGQEMKRMTKEIPDQLKRWKAEERARKRNAVLHALFLGSTYRLRKRLRLLTREEVFREVEVERTIRGFMDEADQRPIRRIRRNEVRPLVLEGSGLNVFPVDPWKVVLVEGKLDSAGANDLLQKLNVLERDDKGKLKSVIAAIGLSADATHQARQMLCDAGAKVVDERPEAPSKENPAPT